MQVSTAGIHLRARRLWLRELVELTSSMRFAISLLAIIAIASVIGTILKQNEPVTNYINQFGPFWAEIFRSLGLFNIYNTPWFLLILAFLVISTSLCLVRNTPKMLRDARSWRDQIRLQSLQAFRNRLTLDSTVAPTVLVDPIVATLARRGLRTRAVARGEATLLCAKTGTVNRIGYVLAHAAIVVICIGGLLDGTLPLRVEMFLQGKEAIRPERADQPIPASGRLSINNPSYRANMLVPEGGSGDSASISLPNGFLVQPLPFSVALKKFSVDYYSTGMPKLFSSTVEITDKDDGHHFAAVIEVNKPLIYRGIAIYQSSFEDGGSRLKLSGYPMKGESAKAFPIAGIVGEATRLTPTNPTDDSYTLEFSGFRAINVENLAEAGEPDDAAVTRKFSDNVAAVVGSGAAHGKKRDLHNVGPSVQYRLRDRNGQAREFSNYMLPIVLDGNEVFLAGVRDNPDEGFRYLRIPADADHSVKEFMRLRAALADPTLRVEAARRFAMHTLGGSASATPKLLDQLTVSTERSLETFAGAASPARGNGGLAAVAAIIEKNVPAKDQEAAVGVVMKILGGSIGELWQLARERDGLPPAETTEANGRFIQLSVNALSDGFFYNAPVYLQLDSFEQVQASVFQLTRSPGKYIVYLGCLMLVAGIFSMFYIRERRVWIWLSPKNDNSGSTLLLAMSSARVSLDFEKEFNELCDSLRRLCGPPPS